MAPSGLGSVSKTHFPEWLCAHRHQAPDDTTDLGTTEPKLRNRWGEQSGFPGKSIREGSRSSLHFAIGSQPLGEVEVQCGQDLGLLRAWAGDPAQGQLPA